MKTQLKNIDHESDYRDRFLKLLPSEVVIAYITISAFIPANTAEAKWVSLGVCLILLFSIPWYLKLSMLVKNNHQVLVTMVSFIIWLYSMGGPFALWAQDTQLEFHKPYIGSILLILWTILAPQLVRVKMQTTSTAHQESAAVVS